MNTTSYQLVTPIDAFVFDCDGTLSTIEGIEVLAEANGVGQRVKALTEKAMSHTGISQSLYHERLSLTKPSRQQVMDLAQAYYASRIPQLVSVIQALQSLGKPIYVVSAGVNPAVKLFAAMLDVKTDHVYAVDLYFSEDGAYVDYDRDAHPANAGGKISIANIIKEKHPNLLWIGDGMNDLVVKPEVARFIGFGGVFYREKIAKESDFYVTELSMSPLLALGLTKEEVASLDEQHQSVYEQGEKILLKKES